MHGLTVAGQVYASCTAGTDPCDDVGSVMVGPPLWVYVVALVVVIAIVITAVSLIRRAVRRRRGAAVS